MDFAKQVPGFLQLGREDQIALLKASTIEVMATPPVLNKTIPSCPQGTPEISPMMDVGSIVMSKNPSVLALLGMILWRRVRILNKTIRVTLGPMGERKWLGLKII